MRIPVVSESGRLEFSVQGVLTVRIVLRLPAGDLEIPLSAFGEDEARLEGSPARFRRTAQLHDHFALQWRGKSWEVRIPVLGPVRVRLPSGREVRVVRVPGKRGRLASEDGSFRLERRWLSMTGEASWQGEDAFPALLLVLYANARLWHAEPWSAVASPV